MSHILLPSEIINTSFVGPKTRNLKRLLELGLSVPKFIAVSSEEVIKLSDSEGMFILKKIEEMAQEIIQQLPANSYAIRSSALIEDAKEESLAGQFTTKLNIPSLEITQAIIEVVKQAQEYLHGDLSKFSLLIQEFIEPDYAGIIFTRNPLGGREFVVEYHSGRGEEVVSGRVKPERIELFWNSKVSSGTILQGFKQTIEQAKKIEQHFQFPQDIEWCIKEGKWFWLQTRPITTLTSIQYQQSLYLDSQLPTDKKYFYQKTEISEIAPRPTPLTFSLLEKIYGDNGPVAHVYKKYGIKL
jgi:phosphoenolpyruvate synthase/pyruvate phosphate dikinase